MMVILVVTIMMRIKIKKIMMRTIIVDGVHEGSIYDD